jgi:6,7-dimethyl-8-ribityllumazine synthase
MARFGIVCSRFNNTYTDALLAVAKNGLAGHEVDIVRVPGAWEIPLQAQRMARKREYAVILALGVVWQGETLHATEILRAVTDALMQISLENDVPIVHQVLSVRTEAEARERAITPGPLNRGTEAAAAAIALAGGSKSR